MDKLLYEKITKLFENFALSSLEREVFPSFSTKDVKKIAKHLFSVTAMGEAPLLAQLVHLGLQHAEPLCEHTFRMFP